MTRAPLTSSPSPNPGTRADAPPPWRAAAVMCLAMCFIPAGDTAGKLLTDDLAVAPVFVAWTRFAIAAIVLAPFVPRGALRLLLDWRIVVRALMLMGGITCILTALRTAPLADTFAAFFIGPSVSYLLAVIFLREPLSGRRAALVALGFLGVLLIVRPGGAGVAPGLGWAVAAGCFYGAFLTASRWLSSAAPPLSLLFSQLAIPAILLAPAGLLAAPPLTAEIGVLATASALGSMTGNFLLLFAYRRAPATVLAPLVYFQLVAATGLGWAVFGTLPQGLTWLGLGVVIASGVAAATLTGRPKDR